MDARGVPQWGLLGRDRELAELESALSDVRRGHGCFFLLAGEPGIGKSSLAGAAAGIADREGMLVRWGSAWEGGGAPAFWPWVQILRGLTRDRDPGQLARQLGPGASWIAEIVPEVRDALPDLDAPASIDPDQARFALFDAVASFLRNLTDEQPVALVIDDLHAADQPSILLLEFVARSVRDTPIFLLAAYQEEAVHTRPEIESKIADLGRAGQRRALRRLDVQEMATLVEQQWGGSPAAALVRELHDATEGNPFFASEVVRLLSVEGDLDPTSGAAEVRFLLPDTVREAIRRRFQPLGREALGVLQLAAVVGRQFHLTTLERAGGFDRDRLIDGLDRAVGAGLLIDVIGTPGLYRFTHGLMRETLHGDMPPATRIRAHAAVGEALEQVYRGDPEPHLAELAHHFLEAAAGGLAEKAVDYAARAGERAMRLLAYEQADRLFESALGALDLYQAGPARRAELLLALGRAHVRAGDPAARETLIAAAAAARKLDLPEILAHAALAFRAFARVPGVVDEEVVALLEEALERVDPGDSALRARLLVRLALQLYDRFDAVDRRRELAEEAIAMARRLGDPATLAYVLNNAQLATWSPDTREEALAWGDEVLELSAQVGDLELVRSSHNRKADLLLEIGDLPGADVEIEALERLVSETPEPRARAHLALQRARRAGIEGRFDDAQRLTEEAAELGNRSGDTAIAVVAAGQRWAWAWSRGRLDEVEQLTRRFADAAPAMPTFRASLALVYRHLGRDAEARREYERLAADSFARLPRNGSWLHSVAVLSEVAWQLGDAERAATLHEFLLPFAERNVVGIHSLYAGPVSRYLALLADAQGDREAARRHLDDAVEAAGRAGARAILAMLRLDEASMLAEEDGGRAQRACAEAAEIAEAIGADGLVTRAEALGAKLGSTEAAPATAGAAVATPASATLRREGDVWVFDYGASAIRVRDSKGLRYLARLLANPGVEVHAIDLVGPGDGAAASSVGAAAEAGLEVQGEDSAGPLLDAEAKSAYRERLEELRAEVEEADSFNDPERAARAREEMEFLTQELAGAVGLGGRDRNAASNAERARVNATRSIRSVIKRIVEYDANLGRELDATVRTGAFCAYEPDPRRPVSWTIEGN